jgi:biotin transport system substrate-specific component
MSSLKDGGILLNEELLGPLTSATESADAAAKPLAIPATWLRTGGIVLAGSAFVAVCAHIALPLYFTPVPLTLQTFAVLVLGLLLSPRLAAGTLAAYLGEGALGLPVFAPSPAVGGMAHLLGPTGGYLLVYPAAAALISFLWRRMSKSRSYAGATLSAAAGDVVILASGALWLAVLTHAWGQAVLTLSILPFLPGDVLKIAAAAGVVTCYQRFRRVTS